MQTPVCKYFKSLGEEVIEEEFVKEVCTTCNLEETEESSGEYNEITNEPSDTTIEEILEGSLLQEFSDKALEESIDGILTTTEISTAVLESPPSEDPSTTSATPANSCSLTDFGCCSSNQT